MDNFRKKLKRSIEQHTLIYDVSSIIFCSLGYGGNYLASQNSRYKSFTTLRKKYGKYIGTTPLKNYEKDENLKVWVCWLQGFDEAPELVKSCYKSIKHHIKKFEIVEINKENFHQYANLPDYIIEKWEKGIIPSAQFADILRLQLLIEHGGLWVDATTYLTDEIPDYITDTDFFVFRDGIFESELINMGNWFIYSKSDNIILQETQNLLFRYWKDYNYLTNYFIFHLFFRMVTDHYSDEWKKVPYYNQIDNHIFAMELFYEKYDEARWKQVTALTPIHKLTHKIDTARLKDGNYSSMLDELYLK